VGKERGILRHPADSPLFGDEVHAMGGEQSLPEADVTAASALQPGDGS
jgi:hypothetical protein